MNRMHKQILTSVELIDNNDASILENETFSSTLIEPFSLKKLV